jgi:hypothetical protein
MPEAFTKFKYKEFMVTYKLDGSSITIIHDKKLFKSRYRICSRNLELKDTNNDWHRVFNATNFKEHIDKLVKKYKTNNIIVQGEAIGKFNGNHHSLLKNEIRLFNIFVGGKKLPPQEFAYTCIVLRIPMCPIAYSRRQLPQTMNEILELSKEKDTLNPKKPSEGLVWRSICGGVSFKVINNDYLEMKGK